MWNWESALVGVFDNEKARVFSGQGHCGTSRMFVVCCSVYSGSGSWLGSVQGGQRSTPRCPTWSSISLSVTRPHHSHRHNIPCRLIQWMSSIWCDVWLMSMIWLHRYLKWQWLVDFPYKWKSNGIYVAILIIGDNLEVNTLGTVLRLSGIAKGVNHGQSSYQKS